MPPLWPSSISDMTDRLITFCPSSGIKLTRKERTTSKIASTRRTDTICLIMLVVCRPSLVAQRRKAGMICDVVITDVLMFYLPSFMGEICSNYIASILTSHLAVIPKSPLSSTQASPRLRDRKGNCKITFALTPLALSRNVI